MSTVLCFVDSV
jgi:hypothetical protein